MSVLVFLLVPVTQEKLACTVVGSNCTGFPIPSVLLSVLTMLPFPSATFSLTQSTAAVQTTVRLKPAADILSSNSRSYRLTVLTAHLLPVKSEFSLSLSFFPEMGIGKSSNDSSTTVRGPASLSIVLIRFGCCLRKQVISDPRIRSG